MQLRNYQKTLITESQTEFSKEKRVIMCAPTGAGKTVTFIEIAKRATMRNTDTLILTDRINLYDQTMSVFKKQGLNPQGINANTKQMPKRGLVIAMVQTLNRRELDYTPKLIIIDEAHEGTFNGIIERFPNAYVLGVTATPTEEHKHLAKYYSHKVVQPIGVKSLIEKGYLVKPVSYEMQESPNGVKTTRGDFDNGELFTFFDKPTLYNGVVEAWHDKAKGKRTICFCVNIEHANRTAEAFGDLAKVVTSKTPKEEAKEILEAHQNGEFPILVNVMVFVKGYDDPQLECVITNFSSKSLAKCIQCWGRGARSHEGKTSWTLIDMGGNLTRHGLWQADREWNIKPKRTKNTLGAAPVRKCKCGAMLDASAKECEYCGYVFPVADKSPVEGLLREVFDTTELTPISRASVAQIVEAEAQGRIKAAYAWRVLRKRGLDSLKEYRKVKGYSYGWLLKQEREIKNNKYREVYI